MSVTRFDHVILAAGPDGLVQRHVPRDDLGGEAAELQRGLVQVVQRARGRSDLARGG